MKNKIKSLILTGGLALASGCATPYYQNPNQGAAANAMDSFAEFMIGGGLISRLNSQNALQRGDFRGAQAWSTVADAQRMSYDRNTQIQAAQAGRSEINIYNNPNYTPNRFSTLTPFNWIDSDHNGKVSKDEMLPIENTISVDEDIAFEFESNVGTGGYLTWRVTEMKSNEISEIKENITPIRHGQIWQKYRLFLLNTFESDKIYRVDFLVDESISATKMFRTK